MDRINAADTLEKHKKENKKNSKIERYIKHKKEKGEKVLIPFIMAGDPNIELSEKIALEILEQGGDILEIGLPYSDPLADGPVIQQASQRAKDTRIKDVLLLIERLRQKTKKPLVLLAYFNPIFNYGREKFIDDFLRAGLDGLVIPDLAREERGKLEEKARGKLDLINFITPTSSQKRLEEVAKSASGFIYCVSVAGVTGKRKDFSLEVEKAIKEIKKYTDVPLAIGFGISDPHQAKKAANLADGVIVGSAIIDKISSLSTQVDKNVNLTPITSFVRELKDALT